MDSERTHKPPPRYIVAGQKVDPVKTLRARELRRSMTDAEMILWQNLRGRRLAGFRFRRQQVIDGFIVDFYCHAAGLVLEVDGAVHEQQTEYDRARDQVLAMRGLRVLRLRNDDVEHHLSAVLKRIAAACRATA